jgi:hypothetical protein
MDRAAAARGRADTRAALRRLQRPCRIQIVVDFGFRSSLTKVAARRVPAGRSGVPAGQTTTATARVLQERGFVRDSSRTGSRTQRQRRRTADGVTERSDGASSAALGVLWGERERG